MAEYHEYNGLQRRIYAEGETPIDFPKVPFDKAEIVQGKAPLEIHPKYADKHFFVTSDVTEFIPGVTAEMVDWWWGNMEKGYHIWAPGEHYGFAWAVAPCEIGYEGSVELSYEFDPVHPIRITRLGMQHYPFTFCEEHCWLSSFTGDPDDGFLIHMHTEVEGGIHWRTVSVGSEQRMRKMKEQMEAAQKAGLPPRKMPNIAAHMEYESGRLKDFLPQLFNLWKGHPDPWENVHFDLSTAQNEDGTWRHIHDNKPITREEFEKTLQK